MLKSIACAALAFAASLPATAAATDKIVRNEVVRFDDLNLTSQAGVAALERRIASAARRVCGYNEVYGTRIIPKDVTDCMDSALASARQDVAAKTGTSIRKG